MGIKQHGTTWTQAMSCRKQEVIQPTQHKNIGASFCTNFSLRYPSCFQGFQNIISFQFLFSFTFKYKIITLFLSISYFLIFIQEKKYHYQNKNDLKTAKKIENKKCFMCCTSPSLSLHPLVSSQFLPFAFSQACK